MDCDNSSDFSINTSLESPPVKYFGGEDTSIPTDSKISQQDSLEISITQTFLSNTISTESSINQSGEKKTILYSNEENKITNEKKRIKQDNLIEFDISSFESEDYLIDFNSDTINNNNDVINKSIYSSVYGEFIEEDSLINNINNKSYEGFVTGNNKKISIPENDIQKSRELLGLEELTDTSIDDIEIPDIESISDFKLRVSDSINNKIRHPLTLQLNKFNFFTVFDYQRFKYSCLHLQHINIMLTEENINAEITRRKLFEYSVLRRIFEKEESSTVHCVLKVLERNKTKEPEIYEWLIFDGFYESKLIVNKEIEDNLKDIKGCFNIQVSGMKIISNLNNFEDFKLKVDYNCLFITKRGIGFQKEKGIIKLFNSIKNTGLISGIEFKVIKILNRKITIKCGDFKQTFSDEIESSDKIKLKEKFLNKIINFQKINEIQSIHFTNLLIKDSMNNTALLTWFNCPELLINQSVRMINVKVGKLIGLSFVTCFLSEVDLSFFFPLYLLGI